MVLLAPLALLALLPWALLAWWLLRATSAPEKVPFLHLWPRHGTSSTARHRQMPPDFVIWAMAGLLLAILAASGPALLVGRGETQLLLLIDRGASMSAGEGETRLARLAREQARLLAPLGEARVEVRFVPASPADGFRRASEWPDLVLSATPTAAVTGDELRQVIRDSQATGRPMLVVTDQPVSEGPGVFHVGPRQQVANLGIRDLAVEEGQLLVTLHNTGPAQSAELVLVGAASDRISAAVAPARDGTPVQTHLVVRIPGDADRLLLELEAQPDAWPGDNRFAIARQRPWPTVEAGGGTPPAVRRMAEVYNSIRPPRSHSRLIRISASPEADIITAPATSRAAPQADQWQIADHPVALGVDWPSLPPMDTADMFPFEGQAGWQVLVRRGEVALLAVQESAPRRAWVGFQSATLEQSPAFVRFWADLITWTNGGPERWGWRDLEPSDLVHVSPSEAAALVGVGPDLEAWNLPPVEFSTVHWDQAALDRWLGDLRPRVPLGPWLLAGALAALALAAWRWPGRERREAGGYRATLDRA